MRIPFQVATCQRAVFVLFFATIAVNISAHAQSPSAAPPAKATLPANYGKIPLSFEANQGQADPAAQFLAHGQGYQMALRPNQAALFLQSGGTIRIALTGANPHASAHHEEEQITRTNYFLGSDPKKWITNIPNYARVRYLGVYPGIDLVYYGNQSRLEHDFVVAPHADPAQIAFSIRGTSNTRIDASTGDLILTTPSGRLRLQKPISYQQAEDRRIAIPSSYKLLAHHQVAFTVGAYDHNQPLIIDPVLIYSTYLGGSAPGGGDQGNGIAVDATGSAYIVGTTYSTNFPVSGSANQTQNNSAVSDKGSVAFVTKLNATGTAILYSTYLGGSGGDAGFGIAIDAYNNAYVTGATHSVDFPVTCGAFQPANPSTSGGKLTAFVTKLNGNGNALVYSTYLGGSGGPQYYTNGDASQAIAVDHSGSAYVTGYTYSTDFPVTTGVFQAASAAPPGSANAFVTKLNPAGSALTYSTYLGGTGGYFSGDIGNAIAIDSAGDAFIAGATSSSDFPVTTGSFQPSTSGLNTAFVTELNPTATAEIYSSYLGGTGGDAATAIVVDSKGSAYVAGNTGSIDFPLTAGTLEGTNSPIGSYYTQYTGIVFFGPNAPGNGPATSGGFLTKFSKDGSALVYSTYVEGPVTNISGLAVDSTGAAYLTGSAPQTGVGLFGGFQTTPDALPSPAYSQSSSFLVKLSPDATVLNYATLLGGNYADKGTAIALDNSGNVYLTGAVGSTNFPTTTGAFQPTNHAVSGSTNAFISKFNIAAEANTTTYPALPATQIPTSITGGSSAYETCYPDDSTANTLTLLMYGTLTPGTSGPPLTGVIYITDSINYNGIYPDIFVLNGAGAPSGTFNTSDGLYMDAPFGDFYLPWYASYSGDPVYQATNFFNSALVNGCPSPYFSNSRPQSQKPATAAQLHKPGDLSTTSQPPSGTRANSARTTFAAAKFTLPVAATSGAQVQSSPAACTLPPLTVTLHSALKTYGSPNPTLTYSVSGLLNGDTVTVTPQTSATQTSPAGTYLVSASVTGSAAANYFLDIKDATLFVQKATLRLQPDTIGAVYGSPIPTPTGFHIISGLVNGDTPSTAFTGTPGFQYSATSTSPVGQYPLTLTQGTLQSTNYAFQFFPYTVQIFKAPLTGTIQNVTIHRGDPIPAFTFTWSGFVNGDTTATAVTGAPVITTTATSSASAGHFPISGTLGTLHSQNYYFIGVSGTLTILP